MVLGPVVYEDSAMAGGYSLQFRKGTQAHFSEGKLTLLDVKRTGNVVTGKPGPFYARSVRSGPGPT